MFTFALPAHRWLILGTVALTQLVVVLDGTIVNVALLRAQAELSLADSDRHWVITAYVLTFGAFLLLGGRIADGWGQKRTFLLGLTLFGAASVWGGLAPNGLNLFLARGGQGLAASLLAPAALAILTVTFPAGRDRNAAFAVFGSLSGVGSVLGLLLGGVLTEFASWRWCLLINVPIVLLGLIMGTWVLTESKLASTRRHDLIGALTVSSGFGFLVFGLTRVEEAPVAFQALGPITLGIALLVLFVKVEQRAPSPLLPLYVLCDRTRAGAFLLQALMGAVMIGAMLYLAFHLQTVLRMEPLQAGSATIPITASLMATVPFAIRMMTKFGPRRQLVIGPLISILGMLWLSQLTAEGSYWVEILPGMILFGIGFAFSVVPVQNLALQNVAVQDSGAAAAASSASGQIGGSLGLSFITLMYLNAVGHAEIVTVEAVVAGHRAVFLATTGLLCASVFIAAFMIKIAVPQPHLDSADRRDEPANPIHLP